MQSIEPARDAIKKAINKALKESAMNNGSALPPFRLPQVAQQILTGLDDFVSGGGDAEAVALGRKLGQQGLGLRSVLAAGRALVGAAAEVAALVTRANTFMTLLVQGIAEHERTEFVEQRDEMQMALERAIQSRERDLRGVINQLSTPIIPVHDGVLVLPLIGGIDAERAGMITERLLRAVTDRRAHTVILDVTGVPSVDADVVSAILRSASALALLGAHPVLVGIRPEIARVMTELDVAFEGLVTRANLQSGIAYALQRKGLAVRPARATRPPRSLPAREGQRP